MKFLKVVLVILLWGTGLFLVSYIIDLCGAGIESGVEYGFWYGCLHGLFSVANFIRGCFADVMCKADACTIGYSIAYWIIAVIVTIYVISWIMQCIFKIVIPDKYKYYKEMFDKLFFNKSKK